ncbi:16559_t:CDS:2 [Dentiscutata erythropus]|uniref:16559_t:CDS:1 n=1 Tax=Dentiscutata erythropus TaxID=1348616 RepID=A0A9N9C5Y5_9GLOM|nr:16559_t:CDS:2 [Dentiscutata erythropus]
MSHYSQIKEYKENTNKKICHSLIKNPGEFVNASFYRHHAVRYAFNDNIGAPVHEKLQTGAKVLEFGCGTGIWTTEVATDCGIHQILPFPDNKFDYVFSRNKTDFFTKNKFQGFLFETFRVLKPGEISSQFIYNPLDALWHKEYEIDFDLITCLEDYLQMTEKAELISSQIVKLPLGGDGLGEFACNYSVYYIKLIKEFLVPYMRILFKEYDHMVSEIENELRDKRGEIYFKQKRVFARKKVM